MIPRLTGFNWLLSLAQPIQARNRGLALLKIMLSSLLLLMSPVSLACQLTMQAQHFPPRFIKDAAGNWSGFNIEVFRLLANKMGCEAQFLEIPWGRAIQLLASGGIDAMSNMSYNAERAEFALFIGPHQQEQVQLVTNQQPDPAKTSLTDLIKGSQLITLMKGIYYGQAFEQAIATFPEFAQRLVFVTTNQQKLELFLTGRVQFMLEDQINLQQLYQQQILEPQRHPALFILYENPVYFAFSKQRWPNKEQLDKAWQELVVEGAIEHLHHHYFDDQTPQLSQ